MIGGLNSAFMQRNAPELGRQLLAVLVVLSCAYTAFFVLKGLFWDRKGAASVAAKGQKSGEKPVGTVD